VPSCCFPYFCLHSSSFSFHRDSLHNYCYSAALTFISLLWSPLLSFLSILRGLGGSPLTGNIGPAGGLLASQRFLRDAVRVYEGVYGLFVKGIVRALPLSCACTSLSQLTLCLFCTALHSTFDGSPNVARQNGFCGLGPEYVHKLRS